MRIVNLLIIMLFAISCSQLEDNRISYEKLKASESMYKGLTNFVLEKEILQYKIEGLKVPDTINFTTNGGRFLSINKLLIEVPMLFFVFDNYKSCDICVEEAIEALKNIRNKNKRIKIAVVSDFLTTREFRVFYNRIANNDIILLSCNYKALFNNFSIDYPSFFIVDKSMNIRMFFIHDQAISQVTDKYLNIISDRYFE